jgi:NTE family protein
VNTGSEEHDAQRALVLQGGGALGAYEAGVFKALCEILPKKEGKNLFDIVAGTSAGAINSCLIVNHVVKTKSWQDAANMLYRFWREIATTINVSLWPKNGFVSDAWRSLEQFRDWQTKTASAIAQLATSKPFLKWREEPFLLPLYFFWPDNFGPLAGEEATRRYRSWNLFALGPFGTPNVLSPGIYQPDFAFFNPLNSLIRYSNAPLVETIKRYWDFEKDPIKTDYGKGEPRLLFVAVDIMDGTTVTFDSYEKSEGSWKTEYVHANPDGSTEQHGIKYDSGLSMDHLLASMSSHLRHRPPSLTATTTISKDDKVQSVTDQIRYFWDGFYLSNTPLREVLQGHRDYWHKGEGKKHRAEKILTHDSQSNVTVPNLEVFIVNLYPTLEKEDYPKDPDGINNRVNDVLYHDKTEYDEKVASIVTDYVDLADGLARIAVENARDPADMDRKIKEFKQQYPAKSAKRDGNTRTYADLLDGRFAINRVVKIELSADARNDIYGKAFEFSSETIENLLRRGYEDAVRAVAKSENS